MGQKKKRNSILDAIFIVVVIAVMVFAQEDVSEYIKPQTMISETGAAPEVYFCPEDSCDEKLDLLLESANVSIHCAIYDVELMRILDTYTEKSAEIDTGLVTDKDNAGHLEDIKYVANDGTHQLMHNKFCIIDDEIVFMGSYNPTITGMKNDNNMIIIYSKYIAANYEREFAELENREFGRGDATPYPVVYLNGMKIENYFCPEDECGNRVMEILSGARESIDFMTFTFTHDGIGEMIISRHQEGVRVRGVFEKFQNSQWSEYSKMTDENMSVKWDSNPKNMHNKVFIVDEKIVVTGSFNPTKAADTKNDENILIIHDEGIALKYLDEFERVFSGK